ncbi:MAG TPA: HAMP domain-containing sensor histidine kinase, partial [Nitrososphaeraceae archaeon]|nr:HAMP domain-containing sensor histidine kinase [Nitrososphaeraceae archaeon]
MSNNTTIFRRLPSKIITKIGILVVIEIIIILSSFVILAYFESLGTYLGNSINIAGKNRFLTANVQLATVEYQSGSSNLGDLSKAIDTLESNIRALKDGGSYLGLELRPLPLQFLNYWNVINQNWDDYKKSIVDKIIKPMQTTAILPSAEELSTTKESKTKASALIGSSDALVTKLGEFAKINSQNLMLLQILLGILNIMILAVLSYLIVKMLEPISALTKATAEVKKGNLDVTVAHAGRDELSDLSQSFNSMVDSIKNYRRNQNELTDKLAKTNEELKRKEKLKDEFINVASHELKSPIQPILGLAGLALKGKIKHEEAWEVTLRQARKLEQLANDILDVSRIESGNLSCKMEKVRINEIILDVVAAAKLNPNLSEHVALNTKLDTSIEVVADKLRITQLLGNIIGNAAKFTTSGNITVETRVHLKENEIEIRIVDTG